MNEKDLERVHGKGMILKKMGKRHSILDHYFQWVVHIVVYWWRLTATRSATAREGMNHTLGIP
jgi:hypothetical protein